MTTRLDRRWRQARSLADLGRTAADWLEGRVPGEHPNGHDVLDPETDDLIPVLAAANRRGFFTDNSQPGHGRERGWDGAHYEQRAAVDGWIWPGRQLDRISAHAKRAGITVITQRAGSRRRPGVPVTTRNSEPVTWFGVWMPHGERTEWVWCGVGDRARRGLRAATHLALIDPEWGPSTRLWDALAAAIR